MGLLATDEGAAFPAVSGAARGAVCPKEGRDAGAVGPGLPDAPGQVREITVHARNRRCYAAETPSVE